MATIKTTGYNNDEKKNSGGNEILDALEYLEFIRIDKGDTNIKGEFFTIKIEEKAEKKIRRNLFPVPMDDNESAQESRLKNQENEDKEKYISEYNAHSEIFINIQKEFEKKPSSINSNFSAIEKLFSSLETIENYKEIFSSLIEEFWFYNPYENKNRGDIETFNNYENHKTFDFSYMSFVEIFIKKLEMFSKHLLIHCLEKFLFIRMPDDKEAKNFVFTFLEIPAFPFFSHNFMKVLEKAYQEKGSVEFFHNLKTMRNELPSIKSSLLNLKETSFGGETMSSFETSLSKFIHRKLGLTESSEKATGLKDLIKLYFPKDEKLVSELSKFYSSIGIKDKKEKVSGAKNLSLVIEILIEIVELVDNLNFVGKILFRKFSAENSGELMDGVKEKELNKYLEYLKVSPSKRGSFTSLDESSEIKNWKRITSDLDEKQIEEVISQQEKLIKYKKILKNILISGNYDKTIEIFTCMQTNSLYKKIFIDDFEINDFNFDGNSNHMLIRFISDKYSKLIEKASIGKEGIEQYVTKINSSRFDFPYFDFNGNPFEEIIQINYVKKKDFSQIVPMLNNLNEMVVKSADKLTIIDTFDQEIISDEEFYDYHMSINEKKAREYEHGAFFYEKEEEGVKKLIFIDSGDSRYKKIKISKKQINQVIYSRKNKKPNMIFIKSFDFVGLLQTPNFLLETQVVQKGNSYSVNFKKIGDSNLSVPSTDNRNLRKILNHCTDYRERRYGKVFCVFYNYIDTEKVNKIENIGRNAKTIYGENRKRIYFPVATDGKKIFSMGEESDLDVYTKCALNFAFEMSKVTTNFDLQDIININNNQVTTKQGLDKKTFHSKNFFACISVLKPDDIFFNKKSKFPYDVSILSWNLPYVAQKGGIPYLYHKQEVKVSKDTYSSDNNSNDRVTHDNRIWITDFSLATDDERKKSIEVYDAHEGNLENTGSHTIYCKKEHKIVEILARKALNIYSVIDILSTYKSLDWDENSVNLTQEEKSYFLKAVGNNYLNSLVNYKDNNKHDLQKIKKDLNILFQILANTIYAKMVTNHPSNNIPTDEKELCYDFFVCLNRDHEQKILEVNKLETKNMDSLGEVLTFPEKKGKDIQQIFEDSKGIKKTVDNLDILFYFSGKPKISENDEFKKIKIGHVNPANGLFQSLHESFKNNRYKDFYNIVKEFSAKNILTLSDTKISTKVNFDIIPTNTKEKVPWAKFSFEITDGKIELEKKSEEFIQNHEMYQKLNNYIDMINENNYNLPKELEDVIIFENNNFILKKPVKIFNKEIKNICKIAEIIKKEKINDDDSDEEFFDVSKKRIEYSENFNALIKEFKNIEDVLDSISQRDTNIFAHGSKKININGTADVYFTIPFKNIELDEEIVKVEREILLNDNEKQYFYKLYHLLRESIDGKIPNKNSYINDTEDYDINGFPVIDNEEHKLYLYTLIKLNGDKEEANKKLYGSNENAEKNIIAMINEIKKSPEPRYSTKVDSLKIITSRFLKYDGKYLNKKHGFSIQDDFYEKTFDFKDISLSLKKPISYQEKLIPLKEIYENKYNSSLDSTYFSLFNSKFPDSNFSFVSTLNSMYMEKKLPKTLGNYLHENLSNYNFSLFTEDKLRELYNFFVATQTANTGYKERNNKNYFQKNTCVIVRDFVDFDEDF